MTTTATPTTEQQPDLEQDMDADAGALFDKAKYDDPGLQLPKIGGQALDKIRIKINGGAMLDRLDKDSCQMFRRFADHLGAEFELRVSGRVKDVQATGATNREGDLDVIVGAVVLHVDTVYLVRPEDMLRTGAAHEAADANDEELERAAAA